MDRTPIAAAVSWTPAAVATVAVVIPVLTVDSHLMQLPEVLRALQAQDQPPDEMIIVGHRMAELARPYLAAYSTLPVRLVENPSGTIPAGLNLGIAEAHAEFIVRLDVHARPHPDYLRRCLETLTTSKAEMVGGQLEIRAWYSGPVAEAVALAVGHPLGAGDARYRLQAQARAGDVDIVPYACFRRSLWQRARGFDENLLANEDYEFCWRVRRAGGRVHFDPALRSTYFPRPTLRALARQYFRYGWWKMQMLRRNPASLRWRQVLPPAALACLAALFVSATFHVWARFALTGVGAAYLLGLEATALFFVFRRRPAALLITLPLAFLTIHFAWSAGAWANLLTLGRLPRWPLPSVFPSPYE